MANARDGRKGCESWREKNVAALDATATEEGVSRGRNEARIEEVVTWTAAIMGFMIQIGVVKMKSCFVVMLISRLATFGRQGALAILKLLANYPRRTSVNYPCGPLS